MISYFNGPIGNLIPYADKDLDLLLDQLKSETMQGLIDNLRKAQGAERKEIKNKLPYVTPAGTFTERRNECLKTHSGYICLDFDDLDDAEAMKDFLIADEHCLLAFVSPTGAGVKFWVKSESIDSNNHKEIFNAALNHYAIATGIPYGKSIAGPHIDPTDDLSRACYISYDPLAYYNPSAAPFVAVAAVPVKPKKESAGCPPEIAGLNPVEHTNYYNFDCPKCGGKAYFYKDSWAIKCSSIGEGKCNHVDNIIDRRIDIKLAELEADKENEKILHEIFNSIRELPEMKKEKVFNKIKAVTGIGLKAIKKDCENYTKAEVDKHYRVGNKAMKNPDGWRLCEHGLFDADGTQISHYPFYVDQHGVDGLTGIEYVRAVHKKDGKEHPRIVPKRMIAITRDMEKLADQGFPVNTANMLSQVRFLSGWCAVNRDLFDTFVAVSQLGWHGDLFVFPDRIIGGNNENIHYVDNAIDRSAYAKGGTLEGWVEAMRMLAEFPDAYIARFLLYAAFASIALEPLEKRPFIVHLQGDTSTGKTSALRIPASVYGKPVESKTIIKWRSTDNYLIRYMEKLKNIPVIIDELSSENKNPKDGIVYQIESGMSKGKASKDDPAATVPLRIFRLAVFSSGESSLLRECAQGGAQARVIEFSDRAFGGYVPTEQYRKFQTLLMKNYGHAADAFIPEFLKQKNDLDIEYTNDKLTAIEQRVLDVLYIIRACGKIAEKVFSFGFNVQSDITKIWEYMQPRLIDKTDTSQKIMNLVRDFYASNKTHVSTCTPIGELKRYNSEPLKVGGVLVGYRLQNDVGFIKTELKKYLDAEYKDNIKSESNINLVIKNKWASEERKTIDDHQVRLIVFPSFFRGVL